MNQHPRPSLHFKPIMEACAKPTTAISKIQNPGIPAQIGGGLLALLLAAISLPAAGQMAATSNGKFVGNVQSSTTPDSVFDTYWNQVTPENSGKWGSVEATRDVMNWTQLDYMYAYTRTRGIPFKQHTFVWGQQTPAWVTTLTQTEQREEVEEWIAAFATRYPDTEFIDVVNEPLHAPAEYRAALGGAGATGWDWVIWSFEKARLHFPNAKLLLNDYNIINSDTATTNYLTIINLLKDRGLIDGIGEQAHFFESTSITTIQNNLNRLAATGLPVYISELDLDLADDTAQLNRYQTLFPVFWTNPAVRGITFWGYKEGAIWRTNGYLLRADGSERPAMTWLKNHVAANPQSFSASVTSPANGQVVSNSSLVSAAATVTYGTAPFIVTFQKKLDHETEFTTVSSDNTPPYTAELGVLPVGIYQIRAIVTDNAAATATSATHTFTVTTGPTVLSWDGGTTDIAGTGDGASDGGNGTWDTTIKNWDPGNGLAHVAWNNATNDTAVFGNTAGTISLGTGVTVGGLTFASAYIVDSNTVTFGTAGTITNSASVTIASALAGTSSITKAGAGTLTLSGPNTYSGPTVISNGILAISSNNALGATSGNTTIAATGSSTGPQLALSGNINSAEAITLTGNTEQSNYSSVIFNSNGTNTLGGNITLASPSGNIRIGSGGGELIFSGTVSQTATTRTLLLLAYGGAALTVNNAIANNGGGLSVIGGGAVTLKGVSTAIGATNIGESGLLKLGVTNALKTNATLNIGFAFNFTGSDQGTFDLAGYNQTVNALTGTKNSSNIGADSTRVVTNSAASGTSLLTVGNGNTAGTFNGVILDGAGAVAITKIGTGTQTLVANSNYSGVTTINAGTLAITHSNALGSTAGSTTIAALGNTNGGILNLSNNITSPENITITGATEQNSFMSAILNTGGSNTLSGNITLTSPTGGIRLGTSGGSLTFSGTISQTGTSQGLAFFASGGTITVNNPIANNGGSLQIYSTGSVTLKGANGVGGIGATSISQGGTLKLGVSNALNTTGNLTIGGPTTQDIGTFDLAGFDQTVNALVGTVGNNTANSNRKVTNSAAGTGTNTLTVGNGNGSGTFNGAIQNGTTAKTALTKTGNGTITLAGSNTYTGATTINGGGTLILTGATQATTAITFASNSSLGFVIGSPVTAASAAVSFANGTVFVSGTPSASGYVLLTAFSFAGTPVLASAVPGYQLEVVGNQLQLNQVVTDPYTIWAVGGVAFGADTNSDGVANGMAWVLGAANPSINASDKLPEASHNGGNLRITFRCLKSTGRGGVVLKVQSSNDLGVSDPWTSHDAPVPDADATVNGVTFDTTEDGNFIQVIADIPAAGTRLFARLTAVQP